MLVRRELLIQDPEFPTDLLGYLTAEGGWVPCPDELAVNLPAAVAEMLVNSLNREANINAVVKGWGPEYKYSCEYPSPECHPGACTQESLNKEYNRLRLYRSNLERIANIIRGELEAADYEDHLADTQEVYPLDFDIEPRSSEEVVESHYKRLESQEEQWGNLL